MEKNIMETKNLKKLSLKMAAPMVVSMVSLALYNLIDSIFVSNMGTEALTAISLSYPIQAIVTAISLGTSIGVNSVISRKLGEKKKEVANDVSLHGIFLILISYLIVALFGLTSLRTIFKFFTKDALTLNYTVTYLSICLAGSFGLLYQILFEKISEAHGKTIYSMVIQFSGAVINLILDPLLIYGYKFIPSLGIKGAAIATIIGQISGMLIGVILLNKKYIQIKKIKINKQIISDIYKVGVPTIISESLAAFVSLILNKLLLSYSTLAVPFWGIYNKVQSFVFMIVYGFNYGMIPIVGYNFGAKTYDRMKKIIKLFIIYALIIMGLGIILFMFGGKIIFKIYGAEPEIVKIGVNAFRILSIGFAFAAFSLVFSSVFQALGKGTYNLIVYLCRQLIITIPLILILKSHLSVNNIWYIFVLAEFIAMIVSVYLYKKTKKQLKF